MSEESSLIKKARQGDRESFGLLYDVYAERIYRFVYVKTQHKETAEDIVSEVFMKAVRSITAFESEKGSFQAWLYRIARNAVIDHYRQKHHDASIEDAWDIPSASDPGRDTELRQSLEKVEAYLAGLPSEQRDIIIMRLWQELSFREIASALGKSEAAAKMAFSRAIGKLRDGLPAELFLALMLTIMGLKNLI